MSEKKERLVYLDAMRIMACFLVIFNHLPGYTLYQKAGGGVYAMAIYVRHHADPDQCSAIFYDIGNAHPRER